MRTRIAMPTSVSGTSIASAVTPVAKARSKLRVTRSLEDLTAAARARPEDVLGCLHDIGGQRGVPEILGEGLTLVRTPPREAEDRLGLALVGEVLVDEEERERRDRPGLGVRRIGDRDLGRLAGELAEVRQRESVGGLAGRGERGFDVLARGVLHRGVAELVLDGVDE